MIAQHLVPQCGRRRHMVTSAVYWRTIQKPPHKRVRWSVFMVVTCNVFIEKNEKSEFSTNEFLQKTVSVILVLSNVQIFDLFSPKTLFIVIQRRSNTSWHDWTSSYAFQNLIWCLRFQRVWLHIMPPAADGSSNYSDWCVEGKTVITCCTLCCLSLCYATCWYFRMTPSTGCQRASQVQLLHVFSRVLGYLKVTF